MERKYELYLDGVLATRTLTHAKAEKIASQFLTKKAEIYKIVPTVTSILIYSREATHERQ